MRRSNDSNIKKAGSLYQLYASRSRYVGPKSKEELIEFMTTNEKVAANLERMDIDRSQIESYLVSENDGEEFVIRWGVFVNPDLERSTAPLIFERTGKDGVRLVLLANRNLLEVSDDERYEALLNGRVSRNDAITELEKEQAALGAEG